MRLLTQINLLLLPLAGVPLVRAEGTTTFDGEGLKAGALQTFGAALKGIPTAAKGVDLIISWTNIALGFVASIAVAVIIAGGYYYITGDEGKGQSWVKNAVIGIVVILIAYAIVNTLLGGWGSAGGGAPSTGGGSASQSG